MVNAEIDVIRQLLGVKPSPDGIERAAPKIRCSGRSIPSAGGSAGHGGGCEPCRRRMDDDAGAEAALAKVGAFIRSHFG
jgi:hypothetical protein